MIKAAVKNVSCKRKRKREKKERKEKKKHESIEFSAADPIGGGCGGRSGSARLVNIEIHTDPRSVIQVRFVSISDQRREQHDEGADGRRHRHQGDVHGPYTW